ncbi:MAG: hypothetical protein R2856_09530 [Caldilineaceae bacterium]
MITPITLVVIDGDRCAGLLTSTLISKGISDQPSLREAFERISPQASMLEAADLDDADLNDTDLDDVLEEVALDVPPADQIVPMPPPQAPKPVDLHTDIDFPEQVAPRATHPLIIKLTPDTPTDTRVSDTVRVEFADPMAPEVVEVRVHAPDFNERDQRWAQTMEVYSFTASSPAVFMLSAPPDAGILPIGIDFRHRDRLVAAAASGDGGRCDAA